MINRWTVLIAEDNRHHFYCIRRAFEEAAFDCLIQSVIDGAEAIAYLKAEGPYANRKAHPYPDLLLLDLKMPRVSGLEVMKWINQNPEHHKLPVIVLTVSRELKDVNQAYALGAKSFLVKPVNLKDLTLLLTEVKRFLPPLAEKSAPANPNQQPEAE